MSEPRINHRWGTEFARFKWKCERCGVIKHHEWKNRVVYITPDGWPHLDGITYRGAPPCMHPDYWGLVAAPPDDGEPTPFNIRRRR